MTLTIGFGSMDWAVNTPGPDGQPTPGGACWARCVAPATYLARNGHDTLVGRPVFHQPTSSLAIAPWGSDEAVAPDVVVLQRTMHDWAPQAIRRARAAGQIIVSDLDDWYWGMDPRNHAWRASDPSRNPAVNRDHYHAALAASTAVTVSTPYLAERIGRMIPGVKTIVVRNAIDLERYTPKTTDTAGDRPTIGWVGALPWRSGDIDVVADAIRAFCTARGATFHHAGQLEAGSRLGDPKESWYKPAGELMRIPLHSAQPMCPIYDLPSTMFGRFDVGIVPLSDQPFNRAKSWIKGLEYAAAGIPFIASAMPEYVALARAGVGRTAHRNRDWQRELARMADPEWRQELREEAARSVKAFDFADRWVDWANAYRSLL